MQEAVKRLRARARSEHPEWRIAHRDLPEMPSAKTTVWKYDCWLLLGTDEEQLLIDYANSDSVATLALWQVQEPLLKERGLWKIYQERLKMLPMVVEIEDYGVTISRKRLDELQTRFSEEAETAGRKCVNIAKSYSYDLTLPKSGNNNSLREFAFDRMQLPPIARSKKTGEPSLDKATLEFWTTTLPPRSKQLTFVRSLLGKRSRDTALSYMKGYQRFWLPYDSFADDWGGEWFRLHPNLNPTGTDTLRWSSSNPNSQNISKKDSFNLRYAFGPAPGREWWSLDYDNLELRIPAYEAGEDDMVQLFERPDDPPYFGSYHLLVFDLLHPEEFRKHGIEVKNLFKSTLYQWTKNGNFATQYGAVEESGTADRAFHVQGAQRRIKGKFRKITELNHAMIRQAERTGYVETIPDKEVDPKRGYPLLCTRSRWGGIKPTVPLNYHTQGTACWIMMRAMIKVREYLQHISRPPHRGEYRMVMNVHDEIVLDFPTGKHARSNVYIVDRVRELMESVGDAVGVPLTVGVDYHPDNWSESEIAKEQDA